MPAHFCHASICVTRCGNTYTQHTIANFTIQTNRNLIISSIDSSRLKRKKKIINKNHNKFNEQSICRMDGVNKRAICYKNLFGSKFSFVWRFFGVSIRWRFVSLLTLFSSPFRLHRRKLVRISEN